MNAIIKVNVEGTILITKQDECIFMILFLLM